MSSPRPASAILRYVSAISVLRPHWPQAATVRSLGRRLLYFWIVWSALLFVHEAGHALVAAQQGHAPTRVTVGVGPVVWRSDRAETQVVLRLVPLAGMTSVHEPRISGGDDAARWTAWLLQLAMIGGGTLATVALVAMLTMSIAVRERVARTRWVLGRMLVADAIVLTAFNFLPVPPLDGGRVVLGAITAWRAVPIAGDTLFWVQAGGLALAVVPMLLWTRWTARIDRLSMTWRAPRPVS